MRIGQHEGALPEIVEEQARKDDQQPPGHDRLAPEVTQIDIKRLGPGHRQEDRAKHHQCDAGMVENKGQGIERIDGPQHLRRLEDMHAARISKRQEPDRGDRPEDRGHPAGAEPLHHEQRHDDQQGNGHNPARQARLHHL
ncbi:hypothetical protein D3C72_2036070 [compost metagenome]